MMGRPQNSMVADPVDERKCSKVVVVVGVVRSTCAAAIRKCAAASRQNKDKLLTITHVVSRTL